MSKSSYARLHFFLQIFERDRFLARTVVVPAKEIHCMMVNNKRSIRNVRGVQSR